ncbi:MAG: serine/threonine protein kinase [Candidatus Obscuribacterales bacterium]|nr:serine/threonine protein kinase [Candidatus Obscuribacterales bacterium]
MSNPENQNAETSAPRTPEALVGSRYELLGEIAEGAMSKVYLAQDILLQRRVAVKILKNKITGSDKAYIDFLHESRACSALEHPNIVKVLAFGLWKEEYPFLVMELLEGKTLEARLKESCLDIESFEEWFFPVLDALLYAHENGIVHCDLKPGNLMDAGVPAQIQPKILDFGISRLLNEMEAEIRATQGFRGSPLYMSPEQCASGKIDQRSDIYSLACVMYESIVGKPPYSGGSPMETMYEHMKATVPQHVEISNSLKIPRALFDEIIRAMSKKPEDRPQSMQEFRDCLRQALCDKTRMRRKSSWRSKVFLLLILLLCSALAILALAMSSWQKVRSGRDAQEILLKKREYLRISHDNHGLSKVEEFRKAGDYSQAINKCRELMSRCGVSGEEIDDDFVSRCHEELAENYSAMKNYAAADREFEKSVNSYSNFTADGRLKALAAWASSYQVRAMPERALEIYRRNRKEALAHLKGDGDLSFAAFCYQYAFDAYQSAKYDESLSAAAEVLNQIDKCGPRGLYGYSVDASFLIYRIERNRGHAERGILELKKTARAIYDPSLEKKLSAVKGFADNAEADQFYDDAIFAFEYVKKTAPDLAAPGKAPSMQAECDAAIRRLKPKAKGKRLLIP